MKVAMDVSIMTQLHTGTEEYTEGLVWGLNRQGISVTGVGRQGRPLLPNRAGLGLDVTPKRSIWSKWWWERFGLARAVESGVDIVHIPYMTHPPRPLKVPSVVTVHDLIPYRLETYHSRWRERVYFTEVKKNLPLATRIVAISEATRADIDQWMPRLAPNVTVIPNGVHPAYFEPADAELMARLLRRLHLGLRPRILYVGGYDTRKNVETLIHAAKEVMARHRAELVLVGAQGNPSIAALIAEMGLSDSVHLTPFLDRDELVALYHASDVFAFPSRYEGFGLPPAQALAVGVPVVAGDIPAVREVLGDCGTLVKPDDVDEWVDALDSIMKNPAWAAKLALSGRERARQFSWERVAEQYANLYRQMVES